jgi:hypothetical protein
MTKGRRLIRAGAHVCQERVMKPTSHLLCRLGLAAALASSAAVAQTLPQVRVVPQAMPQMQAPTGAGAAAASAAPQPSGLRSRFPAGLPTPVAPGARGSNRIVDGVLVDTMPATQSMGAAGYGVPAGAQGIPSAPASWNAVDVARSFLLADANRDGELTRAEATRLDIMPLSFEDMDRNHDGTLTRSEYEDALR